MTKCEEIHVSVPDIEPDRSAAIAALHHALASLPSDSHAEVWVDLDPFPAVCALVNGEQAWMMRIRHEDDPGFSSRDPGYGGPPEATLRYTLANGQVDDTRPRGHIRDNACSRRWTRLPGPANFLRLSRGSITRAIYRSTSVDDDR